MGKRVEFTSDAVNIYDLHSSSKIATTEINNGARLYTFSKFIESESSLVLTHADYSSRFLHDKFGHINYRYMQQLSKNEMVEGLPNVNFSKEVCEGCVLGKHHREKFDTGKTHRASSPLDLIHSDLVGPFPHPSINKARYVLTFIDDFSRYTWVYLLRVKSEVFAHFEDFKALVETQSERNIKSLCTDNGGEYVNTTLENLCFESGI